MKFRVFRAIASRAGYVVTTDLLLLAAELARALECFHAARKNSPVIAIFAEPGDSTPPMQIGTARASDTIAHIHDVSDEEAPPRVTSVQRCAFRLTPEPRQLFAADGTITNIHGCNAINTQSAVELQPLLVGPVAKVQQQPLVARVSGIKQNASLSEAPIPELDGRRCSLRECYAAFGHQNAQVKALRKTWP